MDVKSVEIIDTVEHEGKIYKRYSVYLYGQLYRRNWRIEDGEWLSNNADGEGTKLEELFGDTIGCM